MCFKVCFTPREDGRAASLEEWALERDFSGGFWCRWGWGPLPGLPPHPDPRGPAGDAGLQALVKIWCKHTMASLTEEPQGKLRPRSSCPSKTSPTSPAELRGLGRGQGLPPPVGLEQPFSSDTLCENTISGMDYVTCGPLQRKYAGPLLKK